MRRVVITGMGLVSSLGNDLETVSYHLRTGRSGIRFNPAYADIGMRSHVCGAVSLDMDHLDIDRKVKRFMGDAAAYAYLAMQAAVKDSGLEKSAVSNPRTGLIAGSGGTSCFNHMEAMDILRAKGISRVGPFRIPRIMSNTVSASLATPFRIQGMSYSIASACATSAHCIGRAAEQIRMGNLFDAMGALSSQYNDAPHTASRAYDTRRDGFVIAGGGGIVVLEALEHALARGAKIHGEIIGYGATSDGYDMVTPSGEGSVRCMRMALARVEAPVDYLNSHGTSTPVGDLIEMRAVRKVFSKRIPQISSTKSLSGHALGAAGVHEVIYCLLMMKDRFLAGSANVDTLDPELKDMPILRETLENKTVDIVMSNSFGFGGTNATLVLKRWKNE
jgi:3-oxoacyl-[acyl-carrier-protein] synthase I